MKVDIPCFNKFVILDKHLLFNERLILILKIYRQLFLTKLHINEEDIDFLYI